MIFSGCGRKYVSLDDVEILNYTRPQSGEKIAVISIKDYGDIKIKLFPEQCPKGVENFEKLIESGYYDGTVFHRVIQNFMIQGGDPTGTGSGGESIWGDGFEQEINSGLRHFSGAVSYATSDDKLNGSQFFIVTGASDIDFQSLSDNGYYFPENVADMYESAGGYPPLDGNYEVFGQVFEGLEICFKIAAVQTDENNRPVSDIIIEKAQITEFEN
ncbi:MAG TPA: peptidylprolyl isomerase [Ruminococcus sp.]|nr:peptidylprolyl isomerase [Ruminococcus sp.]HCR73680.1 peptidylprolyl isomerase [Ruminococcus sp.]